MANDLNRWQGIGRLGNDVDTRYMPDGKAVASLSIACGSSWKDKQTGEKQERTEWVNITAFGKLAEIMDKYLHKGSKVFIEGEMRTEKWQDKEGKDRYTTKIIASNLQMLDGKPEGQQAAPQGQPAQHQAPQSSGPASGFEDFDQDIPF